MNMKPQKHIERRIDGWTEGRTHKAATQTIETHRKNPGNLVKNAK